VQTIAFGLARWISRSNAPALTRSMPRRSRCEVALCGVLSAFWCRYDQTSGARFTSWMYQSV